MPRSVEEYLRLAVERGLISPSQEAALRALAAEEGGPAPAEMPRGFNWVTVAYALGALLVVFACGWFLAERWVSLGAGGVLGVVAVYAAVLAVSIRWLERAGFPEAAGITALIAVALTPVAVWAVQSLTGYWPAETWGKPYYPAWPAAGASRWVVAELATILAALLVLRRRPYVAVVFPIAVSLFGLALHIPRTAIGELTPVLERWTVVTGAVVLCGVADAVDRRVPRTGTGIWRGDMAFPLWVVGLATLGLSLLSFWPTAGVLHHGLPFLAIAAVSAALYMGRKSHLVFGILALFLYLIYLAAEVFRSTAFFPLVLAAIGGLLLLATVWLQRRFPALVQRLAARRKGRGGLPGSPVMPWLMALMALCITLLKLPEAAEERIDREFRQRLEILRMHSGSSRPRARQRVLLQQRARQAPAVQGGAPADTSRRL